MHPAGHAESQAVAFVENLANSFHGRAADQAGPIVAPFEDRVLHVAEPINEIGPWGVVLAEFTQFVKIRGVVKGCKKVLPGGFTIDEANTGRLYQTEILKKAERQMITQDLERVVCAEVRAGAAEERGIDEGVCLIHGS